MLNQQQINPLRTPLRRHAAVAAAPQQYERHRKRSQVAQAAAIDSCMLIAVAQNVGQRGASLYEVGQFMNGLVQQELTDVSPTTCVAVLAAGLLTSVSPCTLSVLPLTIGYIAGYAGDGDSNNQQQQQPEPECCSSSTAKQSDQQQPQQVQEAAAAAVRPPAPTANSRSSSNRSSRSTLTVQAVCFSLGLASSLAALGVVSSTLGRAYGSIGAGLPSLVALVAILMGLNLLEVVRVPLPSLFANVDVRAAGLPPQLSAYAAGALFALAASPCSTPVLASILAYASTQESPFAGGLLLFLYSCGYVAPLLVAATATGAAKRLLELRQYSAWVTPASGVLLVSGGTYALLTRLLPAV